MGRRSHVRMAIAGIVASSAGLPLLAQAQSSPSAFTSAMRYDAAHRVTGTILPDPDGGGPLAYAATRNTYDSNGWLVRIETGELSAWQSEAVAPANWNGFSVIRTTDIAYDAAGRKIRETVSSGGAAQLLTQYSYDDLDRPTCTAVRMNSAAFGALPADACSLGSEGSMGPDRITRTVYDDAGRVWKTQKAYGTPLQQDYATYTYTGSGKVASMTDANGALSTMGYDTLDRQNTWYFPSKTALGQFDGNDHEEYGYDANDNRTSLRKRDRRVIAYAYDALNRMTAKGVADGCAEIQVGACTPGWATRDVYYGYDLRGLQAYARFDSASGEGVTNGFDALGRPVSSTTALGGYSRTLTYQYDQDGNRVRITHPDGTYFDTTYDGLDRMDHASWTASGVGTVPFMAITYDTDGKRWDINRASSYTGYGYDGAGRLAAMNQRFAGGTGNIALGFAYNPASQMVTQTRSSDDYAFTGYVNVDRSYGVNGQNQYVSAGAASFDYDHNGNLITDGSSTYVYDAENRLVSASGARSATLVYDPLGRLFQTSGGSAGTTQFLYDGDALVAEYDGSGTLLRRYMHGPGVDEPIMWDEGSAMNCSGSRFLHTDHQGSVVAVANCWGDRIAVDAYDEYGIPNPTNVGRFQYTGQAWIPELGMYYYKARIYSPTLGRFLQTDPIGYKDQNNLYAYVANDPVNKTDPTGTYECSGSKAQCGAVESAYNRAATALKSDNLSKGDRAKLQGAFSALGKPGQANGVNVGFASGNAIARATNGRSDIGYTERGEKGTINVRLNNNFGTLYDNYKGNMFGKDFSRLSPRDERSGIFVHEGRHVYQNRNGMTPEAYMRDTQRYERDAKDTGKLLNKAYGSVSVYDTPED